MDSRVGLLALAAVLAIGALRPGSQAQAQGASRPVEAPPVNRTAIQAAPLVAPSDVIPAQNLVAPPVTPAAPLTSAPPQLAEQPNDEDQPKNQVVAPIGPPPPAHAQSAVLRVLDKVTAETMAFEAPIGRRVRYKSMVFEVKACVTRDLDAPEPKPSAYLVVTSDPAAAAGTAVGPHQVFKGWMFANAPGVHALTHPVFDAWLVSCNAAAAPA